MGLDCSRDIHPDAFGNQTLKPGVCYLLDPRRGPFEEARAFCRGLNASLGWDVADIEDSTEKGLLHDALAALQAAGSP